MISYFIKLDPLTKYDDKLFRHKNIASYDKDMIESKTFYDDKLFRHK